VLADAGVPTISEFESALQQVDRDGYFDTLDGVEAERGARQYMFIEDVLTQLILVHRRDLELADEIYYGGTFAGLERAIKGK
jgi:hypothetical protein